MSFSYSKEQGFFWLPKIVTVGAPQWFEHVVKSPTCPDQRKYRRLTRAERNRYEEDSR